MRLTEKTLKEKKRIKKRKRMKRRRERRQEKSLNHKGAKDAECKC